MRHTAITFLTAIMLCMLVACGPGAGLRGTHRMKLTVNHAMVGDSAPSGFPVYVEVSGAGLRTVSRGGHVARDDGGDICFTLADGISLVPFEIASYDPAKGKLTAWVKAPRLSPDTGTVFWLWYGGSGAKTASATVWDDSFVLVKHAGDDGVPGTAVSDGKEVAFGNAITVEAWVETADHRPEAIQPLVSKWALSESFDAFDAYDAGSTDGLRTIGYFGAVFDGRHVYFSPQRNGHDEDSTHGYALRYDTLRNFKDPSSWEAYDAGMTDGLETKGHYGAVFDGRYVYFVPRGKNYGNETGTFNQFQSNLLRYDTRGGFKDPSSWAAYDMGADISKQSAAFDGRYIYFCPGYEHKGGENTMVDSSKIIRFDTKAPFHDPSSYRILDLAVLLRAKTGNYDGAVFDGRYVYFVPLVSAAPIRYDTRGDFGAAASWETFDATPLGMKMNVGAMYDGRYIYYAAYGNGVIVRYDTKEPFGDRASWSAYDAAGTDGLDTAGFDGGFYDGRYVYFAPFVSPRAEGGYNFHTNWLRYDTTGAFDDPSCWKAYDASNTDGLPTIGYNGGAFDGRFIYLAPWQDRTDGKFGIHGNILRYDTTGDGAAFCLQYTGLGHNGGLGAALFGPGFVINTVNGPAQATVSEQLLPGRHHIAGVYDGRTVRLYIDGLPAAERPASGVITANDVPVIIGAFEIGTAAFSGVVRDVRISNVARDAGWIATAYRNLADPSGFVAAEPEEAGKPR